MEVVFVLIGIAAIAGLVYVGLMSSKAKKHRNFTVRVRDGENIQGLLQRVYRGLPQGWTEVGSKKSHASKLGDWAASETGGNLLDVALGNSVTGMYVVSVEMSLACKDEFGRPFEVPFDQASPQSKYDGHMWVSFASRGQGRTWPIGKSLAIGKVEDYLEDALSG